jgi:hypothetical protein
MLAFFVIFNNTSVVRAIHPTPLSPKAFLTFSLPLCYLFTFITFTFNMGKYDIAQRTLVLTMKTFSMDPRQISDITGIPVYTIKNIWDRVIERGFNPKGQLLMITEAYVIDAPRSGRPTKQTPKVSAQARIAS